MKFLNKKRRSRNINSRLDSNPIVKRNKRIAFLAKLGFLGVLALALILFVVFPLLAVNLPSPDKVVRREGFSTQILDRNGEVLYDIYADEKRTSVKFEELPDYLKQGVVSVEDKNFYKHRGFDPTGYVRAVFNIIFKGKLQGGSTLTQQLVKVVLLSPERTVVRKIKEFVLSAQIEARFSKDEILLMYLNEVPYGGTAVGVGAASETYFGKKVSELNLVESAFLAGVPQRPSAYSPYSSTPDAYIGRTTAVLRRMREDGYITKEQEEEAIELLPNLEFQPRGVNFKAPHFVQYVQSILEERYGDYVVQNGGLRVTTTLDLELQENAQQIVSDEIDKVENYDIGNGAAIVLDSRTGEILAMVGSRDFNNEEHDGQVNVTLRPRQPGSAIKPIVYLTGLQKGYTASTLFLDVPTKFPGGEGQKDYEPVNYDGEFRGPVQMRYALANSINVPAVKMISMVGVKSVLETAYDLGIESLKPTDELMRRVGLSLALGGGEVKLIELTAAYAPIMNGGYKIDPIAILRVEDKDGKVLEETKIRDGKQVISSAHSFILFDMLSDNLARSEVFGLNSLLNIPGWKIAVKTGTTNDKKDNWAVGGNNDVVVGAWVGNNDNTSMKQVASGVSGATPIWRNILLSSLKGKSSKQVEVPDDVVSIAIDKISGFLAHDNFESRNEYFVKGVEPKVDEVHVKLKICKNGDKLATPSQIGANQYDEKEFIVLKEKDAIWQEGVIEWINSQTDNRYKYPTEYCEGGGNLIPINVEFESPRDRDSNLDNNFTIKFKIDSTHSIKLAELEIDGNKIRSFTGKPYEHSVNLSDGVHILRVVAYDDNNNQSDRVITIGVNTQWDAASPSPSPTATP